jgi:predicted  nucleic acid-binding Zn-ribbon protein
MYIGKLNGQRPFLNINAINRSAANQTEALFGKKKDDENRDATVISPVGKKQSMLELLMKQKEFLQEQKKSLMDSSQENGTDVKAQLEEFEKRLKEIDNQISQLQARQAEETEDEDSDGRIYDKPKTKEEAQADQLNGISVLSANQEQAETIHQEKNHLAGTIRVLEAEISRGHGNIEAKSKKVTELKGRSLELNDNTSHKLENVHKSIEEIRNESSEAVIDDGEDVKTEEKNELDGQ